MNSTFDLPSTKMELFDWYFMRGDVAGLGEACTYIATRLFAMDTTVKTSDSKTVTEESADWLQLTESLCLR